MFSRRGFIKRSLLLGAGFAIPNAAAKAKPVDGPTQFQIKPNSIRAAFSVPTLLPINIPKYITELVRPPAMPGKTDIVDLDGKPVDFYEIGVRQFQQQILPPTLPATTVWGYGPARNLENDLANFHYPAFTIEATANKPVRVRWVNQLFKSNNGTKYFLPHLLAVDPTLHWANPAGPVDIIPKFNTTPAAYQGPVPMITHVHGAHVGPESDGYPEAWWLPAADNIPASFSQHGSSYERNQAKFKAAHGSAANATWTNDSAVFQYPNDQRAGILWYHDHTLGMTRLNVYAGPAGFYLLRGGKDGNPISGTLPTGAFEFPMGIQDRSFNQNGSLFFPDSRQYFDDTFTGPYIPDSDVHPIWNPEFFGNTIVVNGNTWPKCTVKRARYRIRFLNGCNARTLILKFAESDLKFPPVSSSLPFWVIGTEGGFLPDKPVNINQLTLMPAERYDVIIDFTNVPAQTKSLYLVNIAPDEPYNGAEIPLAEWNVNTGVVMRFDFDAVPVTVPDPSTAPAALVLPAFPTLPAANLTRQVSLNELESAIIKPTFGPLEAKLGTVEEPKLAPKGKPGAWMDPVTESVTIGQNEIWEIYNFTVDAHPIHLHQLMFRVLNRQLISGGPITPPDPVEVGYKDTVISPPGMITRIQGHFDLAGRYVWHCHIIDHEDNEMMRPYDVLLYKYIFPVIGSKG